MVVDQIWCSADPVDPVLTHAVAAVLQQVGQEPVTKGRVVAVQVEQRIRQVRVVPVTLADRVFEPLVLALAGKAEHPAGQHDEEPLVGKLSDQRELHFGRASLAK